MPEKSSIIILIGICVIVVASVFSYAVFVKPEPVVPVNPPVVNNDITPTPPPSTTPIDTSDWQVYNNEKYGYEVKHPSNWLIYNYYYDGKKHLEDLYIQNFSRPKEGGFSGIGGTGCQLNIWVESDKYLSIQKWIDVQKNNIGKDLEKVSTKEIELGEIKGLEITFFGEFLGTDDPVIVILNNGIIYKINESWQNVPQENCQPIFDKILSTFKFTKF